VSEALDLDWEAAEAEWFSAEQRRATKVRVLGYLELCARRVECAGAELDRRVTLLLRARADAERALEVLRYELAEAEEMARLVALDDPEMNTALAEALMALESKEEAA
jgi:hypothetical protein